MIITRIGNIVMKTMSDSEPSCISSFLQEGKFSHSNSFILPSEVLILYSLFFCISLSEITSLNFSNDSFSSSVQES